jgi:hypothetical protein
MLDKSHHHTQKHSIFSNFNLDFLHLFDHKKTTETKQKSGWHFPCPFEAFKNYAKWGRLEFIDENGATVDASYDEVKSNESNFIFKWYEEKTAKYIAAKAAAKKFLPEDDYKNKGKCPIMSLLTSESDVDAKMEEP